MNRIGLLRTKTTAKQMALIRIIRNRKLRKRSRKKLKFPVTFAISDQNQQKSLSSISKTNIKTNPIRTQKSHAMSVINVITLETVKNISRTILNQHIGSMLAIEVHPMKDQPIRGNYALTGTEANVLLTLDAFMNTNQSHPVSSERGVQDLIVNSGMRHKLESSLF